MNVPPISRRCPCFSPCKFSPDFAFGACILTLPCPLSRQFWTCRRGAFSLASNMHNFLCFTDNEYGLLLWSHFWSLARLLKIIGKMVVFDQLLQIIYVQLHCRFIAHALSSICHQTEKASKKSKNISGNVLKRRI